MTKHSKQTNKVKPWQKGRNIHSRNTGGRGSPKPRVLIVCEGKRTEPNYFKSFKLSNVSVNILGIGYNTYSLVKFATDEKAKAKKDNNEYKYIWCVFDKDDFSSQNVNNALTLAKDNDIKIAFSNEAFELWYLLHYHYYNTAVNRLTYIDKLNGLLGKKYEKKRSGNV